MNDKQQIELLQRMIDTQGYGIHEMFESQKKRYLPMPDYDLSDSKRKNISDNAIAKLRKEKLIEGRKPNLYISKRIAKATHQEAEYTDMRGFDDKYYRDLIVQALQEHKELKRADFNRLLLSKLPAVLNDKQKANKIEYLLKQLRKNGKIKSDAHKVWRLSNT